MRIQLNSGVVIGGKYQITAVSGENPVGITYTGTAMQTGQKVIIREFMPQDCCERTKEDSAIHGTDRYEQEKQKYSANAQILLENAGLQTVAQVYELLRRDLSRGFSPKFIKSCNPGTFLNFDSTVLGTYWMKAQPPFVSVGSCAYAIIT